MTEGDKQLRTDLTLGEKLEYLPAALRASQAEVARARGEASLLRTLLDGLQGMLLREQTESAAASLQALVELRDKLAVKHNAVGCQLDVTGDWVGGPQAAAKPPAKRPAKPRAKAGQSAATAAPEGK